MSGEATPSRKRFELLLRVSLQGLHLVAGFFLGLALFTPYSIYVYRIFSRNPEEVFWGTPDSIICPFLGVLTVTSFLVLFSVVEHYERTFSLDLDPDARERFIDQNSGLFQSAVHSIQMMVDAGELPYLQKPQIEGYLRSLLGRGRAGKLTKHGSDEIDHMLFGSPKPLPTALQSFLDRSCDRRSIRKASWKFANREIFFRGLGPVIVLSWLLSSIGFVEVELFFCLMPLLFSIPLVASRLRRGRI